MPIYEYTCKGCGCDFEELVFSSDEEPDCPVCGSANSEKKISTVAAIGGNTGAGCGTAGFS